MFSLNILCHPIKFTYYITNLRANKKIALFLSRSPDISDLGSNNIGGFWKIKMDIVRLKGKEEEIGLVRIKNDNVE